MSGFIFFNVFSLLIGLSFSQYYGRPYSTSNQDSSAESSLEDKFPWDACSTRETRGRCLPLAQCQTLKSYIRERNKHEVSFILQKYGCGFRIDGLRVCCPTDYIRDESTRRPPKTSTGYWHNSDLTSSQKDSWSWPERTTEGSWVRPTNPTRPTRTTWPQRTTTENLFLGGSSSHRNRRLLPLDTCGADLGNKIIGGSNTQLDEFPWTVLLQHTSTDGRRVGFGCGGSLINERYVLTAAHCISGQGVPKNMRVAKVRLGEYDTSKKKDCQGSVCSPDPIDAPVEDIIVHEGYRPNDKAQYNDIALIRLRSKIRMNSYVNAICLPLDKIQNKRYEGEKLVVAGWGRTSNIKGINSSSKIKQKVSLPVVGLQECSPFYIRNGINLKDTQLCAGGQKGKDSCQGDSGGPLMSTDIVESQVRWHVQGIVSYGPEFCGAENVAGVYTRVSKYIDWILDNMRD